MWAGWQIASLIGIFAGALIPHSWSLEFAATLALIAVLVPLLRDRAMVCAALAAGAVALAAAKWPLNVGLLAAIAAGVAVGLAVARLGAARTGRG
jgi:predicted branched-subunit amino acid permease